MAGSKDRLGQEQQERIAERNAIIPPLKQLLHLSSLRREQRDQIAQAQRHELARIAHQYPQHEEQLVALYSKVYAVHRRIADGDAIVGALVREGQKDVFQQVRDTDAKDLLSFYYASNVLHGVGAKTSGLTLDGVYTMRQDVLQKMALGLGVASVGDKDMKKVNLGTVVDSILDKKL